MRASSDRCSERTGAATDSGPQPNVIMVAYTSYRRDPRVRRDSRVRREAEALVEESYDVAFLASPQPGEAHKETVKGVLVPKLVKLNKRRTSVALYMLDYGLFFLLTMAHLLAHPRRYSVIHVSNMPDFLVFATWLPRLLGVPVIHDVHDMMPELFQEKFGSGEKNWIIRLPEPHERWAGRFASAARTVEDRLEDILSSRGVPRERIHVLMNLHVQAISATQGGRCAFRAGLSRNPRPTYRPGHCHPSRSHCAGRRSRPSCCASSAPGFVPVQEIPAMLADTDVDLVPLRFSSGTDIMLPAKLS